MRKLTAFFLCALILLTCCVPALAAEPDTKYADALKTLGLFRGTDKGYELEKSLTREQGVVMIIRLLGEEDRALNFEEPHPFTDLANYAWFSPYAAYAYAKGITKGVSETAFGYGADMTEAMFLTMLLRVLDYKDANDGSGDFVWSDPFALAKDLKIITSQKEGAFTREAMTERCWHTLSARFKESSQTLAEKLISAGVFTQAQKTQAEKFFQTETGVVPAGSGTSGGGSSSGGSSSGGSSGGSGSAPVSEN